MSKANYKHVFSLLFVLLLTLEIQAKEKMTSSVSPEFPDGLHAKYLRYLAKQMSMELKIYPMPFARRIQALKKGEIDIMVGLKDSQPDSDDYYKLQPPYEQIQSLYFLRSENTDILLEHEDLKQLVVGLTIDERVLLMRSKHNYKETVPVNTLHQKIELLMLGRIDAFLHFGQSAQYVIEQENLGNKIVKASFQDSEIHDYYVTISTRSPFYQYKDKLEAIIKQGIQSNDFLIIRQQHYDALQSK